MNDKYAKELVKELKLIRKEMQKMNSRKSEIMLNAETISAETEDLNINQIK